MDKELSANTTLSHYRIVSKIGAGGMGEVYLAEDTQLRRKVALKVLPEEIAADADRRTRFEREAHAASALNHPNILTIHEFGAVKDTHYLASEFVPGETLRDRLGRGRVGLPEALEIAVQIASALRAAHEAGIIHRDIKPENVMVRPDGLVKVLDFGIAKLSENKASPIDEEAATAIKPQGTSPGMVIGTANYMSPEQAKGKQVDARSDIFSFGLVLYEMLSGRRAFAGENALDVIGAILHKEPAPLRHLLPDIPAEVERIVSKTLRKDADERYQTARDLLTDLKDAKQELEFQDKLERTSAPQREEPKTQLMSATTSDTPHTTSSAEFISQEIKRHKRGFAVALVFLLSAVIGLGYWYFFHRSSSVKQIESIAVMPFVNESGNADNEYLSDGITETLINSLSQIPNLSVKARSSVFRYKGKEIDPKKIAAELNVQAILTGRVIQRGEQLTLNLELINAGTENILWGNRYERKSSELVALQSEIARDVSSKLKTKLSGADTARVEKNYTANPEAYQLYLKGRFFWNKRAAAALKQAVEFYRQAIEKDPNYARAYAGLAETYVLLPQYSVALPNDSMPKAKAMALRALEIDDSLAEAHAALGAYLTSFEYDRVGAEKEFRRAIELNPNYATARQWLGTSVLSPTKRFDESLAELRHAERLDPLSPIIGVNVADTFVFTRQYDEAISQYKRVLSLDPNFAFAHQTLGMAYYAKGTYREAIAELRKSLELSYDPTIKGYLAMALAKAGQRDEAMKLLNQLKQESTERYVLSNAIAVVYIGLNQKDEALNWLEKDVAERSSYATYIGVHPIYDDFRGEPRFREMLKRLNLPE